MIPTYNNLSQLKDCVASIQQQIFTDFDVWIVDGDSTDGTKEYLQELQNPFHVVSEKDKGIYDAMNKGISLSKGKWLYFLGGDDVLKDKNVLEEVAKELHLSFDIVSGKIQYQFTESDSRQLKKNNGIFSSSWSRKIWIKNTIHHQATFYKRGLFLKNQFNTDYKVLADYEFNLQLFKNKKKAKMIPEIIALCSTKGISKNYNWSLYKEEIRFKTKASSKLLWILFFKIALLKYLFKKA
ncbi:MAG: glycosyltransferase family 2 protein [Polaribacter sp.]|nr:glycosyltransferase family 2 protein [Polaribacter sp.]MDG1953800.1 glycosyltransferase family 2 protein [Polaribacter sp.]MDG2073035.1 glycosyltransferase family 2 protein [Polaribacter sp.]